MIIRIEPLNAEEIAAELEQMPGYVKSKLRPAIRRALNVGKKVAVERAKSRYVLPGNIISSSISTKISGISGELKSTGSRNPLELAKVRYSKTSKLHATVVKGQGGVIDRAFKKKYSAVGIYQRIGRSRLPIRRLKTVSAPGMISHSSVINPTVERMGQVLNDAIIFG